MKFKKLAMLAALSAASSFTVAAPAAFDGPFVQAGIGYANAEFEVSQGGTTVKTDDDNFIGQIAGGWSQSFGQWNLAGSAYYVIGDQEAGKATDGINTIDLKAKNTWGISIDPGYYFTPKTLGYVKLGYAQTTGKASGDASGDETFNGFAYGLGVKYAFSPNLYGVAEIQQTDFQDKTVSGYKFEPNTFTAIVGVGYKF